METTGVRHIKDDSNYDTEWEYYTFSAEHISSRDWILLVNHSPDTWGSNLALGPYHCTVTQHRYHLILL